MQRLTLASLTILASAGVLASCATTGQPVQRSPKAVAELATQWSVGQLAGSQLVLASQARPPLPMARLRALGGVVEIGVEELAMDQREAHAVLEGAGISWKLD